MIREAGTTSSYEKKNGSALMKQNVCIIYALKCIALYKKQSPMSLAFRRWRKETAGRQLHG